MEFDEEAEDVEGILDQTQNIGYNSNNCILNLKTLYFMLVLYFIRVVGTILLALFSKFTGRGKKYLS